MADDGISFDIAGLDDVDGMLEEMGTKAADRCVRKALRAGAEIEKAAIVERAPDREFLGGTLPQGAIKSDIVIKFGHDEQGDLQAIVGPDKLTAHVARWVEYGHRMVTGGYSKLNKITGKTRGPGKVADEDVPPYEFIRPAYEATRQEAADAMTSTLIAEIEKEAKKKGRS